MPRQRKCPHCESLDIIRSHRSLLERILLFLRPYRCNDCYHRFYDVSIPRLPNRVL
jgi:hypothetical protein